MFRQIMHANQDAIGSTICDRNSHEVNGNLTTVESHNSSKRDRRRRLTVEYLDELLSSTFMKVPMDQFKRAFARI